MRITLTATQAIAAPLLATFVAVAAQARPDQTSRIVLAGAERPIVSTGLRTGTSLSDPTNLGF